MTYEEWAATVERGVTINPKVAFEAQQKRIVDLEQATDLAIQINNDLTSQLEHLERERDAAFAMSRCECEANECQAALALKHEAFQTYVDEHEECSDSDDWMAMMCSVEAHHCADEALAIKPDNRTLREWGARLLEEYGVEVVDGRPASHADKLRSGEWTPEILK